MRRRLPDGLPHARCATLARARCATLRRQEREAVLRIAAFRRHRVGEGFGIKTALRNDEDYLVVSELGGDLIGGGIRFPPAVDHYRGNLALHDGDGMVDTCAPVGGKSGNRVLACSDVRDAQLTQAAVEGLGTFCAGRRTIERREDEHGTARCAVRHLHRDESVAVRQSLQFPIGHGALVALPRTSADCEDCGSDQYRFEGAHELLRCDINTAGRLAWKS